MKSENIFVVDDEVGARDQLTPPTSVRRISPSSRPFFTTSNRQPQQRTIELQNIISYYNTK